MMMLFGPEVHLQAQEFARPGDAQLALVRGDVTGHLATVRLVRREPVQGKSLPVVGPDLDVVYGEHLIGLTNRLPIL